VGFIQLPGPNYRWLASLLPVNATGLITITGTIVNGQTVNNTAAIAATTSVDPNPHNNQAQVIFSPDTLGSSRKIMLPKIKWGEDR
jgi:hypothetical protein